MQPRGHTYTELKKSLGTWLREISSCSSLTFLPGPAWVLLSKICKDYLSALYIKHNKNAKLSNSLHIQPHDIPPQRPL